MAWVGRDDAHALAAALAAFRTSLATCDGRIPRAPPKRLAGEASRPE
jgi:hypothetical protein